jgi:CRP-like cAMP-binding protein
VVTYGEFGTTFYILIKGRVSIRIPSIVEKELSFRETLSFLIENKDWTIQNEKLQFLFNIVQDFIPEIIKIRDNGNLYMNYQLADRMVKGEIILDSQTKFKQFLPEFTDIRRYSHYENNRLKFKVNMMIKVAELTKGHSFGELALLNNTRRSATIVALEDCDFGVIEKQNFEKIVAKMLRKKFEGKVEFLNNFPFLVNMTRTKKEKLCFSMKKHEYIIGQKIMVEGRS